MSTAQQRLLPRPRSMSRAKRHRTTGALLVMLALVGGLAVVLTGFVGPAGVARADTTPNNDNNPYFTLSMTPSATQNLVDGQAMPFTVTRTALGQSTGLEIAAVGTGWCASDVQLPISESPGNQSFNSLTTGFPVVNATTPGAPNENCLDYVNSDLSAVVANGSSLPAIAPPPNTNTNVAGSPGDYPTVSGQALAEVGQGGQQPAPFNNISVNCLPSQSCTFAIAVWTENAITPSQHDVYFLGVPATFLDSSAGLVCNGPATGQISSASPDRLGETLTQLGIDACKSGTGGGDALTFNLGSGNSDDEALCAFANDSVDLAYSAVGYGASGSDFSPANCQGGAEPARPYVAVPIGLNAVVLAHSPNQVQSPPYRGFGVALTNYSQLKITLGQFAQLLSNGGLEDASASGQTTSDNGTWGSQLGQALLALNPQLSSGYQSACAGCFIVSAGSGAGVAATSGTDATTYLATSFLNALVPAELSSAPDPQSARLGTISNFGSPPPAYDVQPYTGRGILAHYTTPLSGSAWWAVTDAATAAATWGGMDDFALQTPDSLAAAPAQATYVAPTTSSMQAAVANMTPQSDGTLLPNPDGGAVNGVEPYPLTYVEYAIAPAQPLLNSDCTANTAAQTALKQWLTFLVSEGQDDLPAGMAPMPSSLVAQATAAIAKVGAAAPACTPTAVAGSSPNATSAGAGSSSSSTPSGSSDVSPYALGSSGLYSDVPGAADGSTSSQTSPGKTAVATPTASSRAAALSLAAFGTVSANGWALPLLGILVLTLLLPGLILLVSGRSLSQALGGLRSQAQPAAADVPPVQEGPGET
jgi:hypothetical protein